MHSMQPKMDNDIRQYTGAIRQYKSSSIIYFQLPTFWIRLNYSVNFVTVKMSRLLTLRLKQISFKTAVLCQMPMQHDKLTVWLNKTRIVIHILSSTQIDFNPVIAEWTTIGQRCCYSTQARGVRPSQTFIVVTGVNVNIHHQ